MEYYTIQIKREPGEGSEDLPMKDTYTNWEACELFDTEFSGIKDPLQAGETVPGSIMKAFEFAICNGIGPEKIEIYRNWPAESDLMQAVCGDESEIVDTYDFWPSEGVES